MSKAIRPDRLANEIMKVLQEYGNAKSDDVKSAVKKSAAAVKKELLQTAPNRTGAYRKSFVVTKAVENSSRLDVIVHSKKHYRLTHLLEDGHALRQGGRTNAHPHMKPAEEHGIEMLESLVKKSLGRN